MPGLLTWSEDNPQDDSIIRLAIRRVTFYRHSYSVRGRTAWIVGRHPWAGAGFKNRRSAERYMASYNSALEVGSEG